MSRPQPTDGFAWVQAPPGSALVCPALEAFGRHLFTTRDWSLGSAADANSSHGWLEVARALDVEPSRLIRVHQVHGASVRVHRTGELPQADQRPDADIIVSDDPRVAISVQAADCVPLLLADSRTGAVAAAHAGWRGLTARVPPVAVEALANAFGSRPSDLVAAIGPSIGACCYEVGADVREAFRRGFSGRDLEWFSDGPQPSAANPPMERVSPAPRAGHWFFNAWAAARAQLESAGVPPDQIHVAALCTASHPNLFCSYRRDGQGAGRMAGAIIARPRETPR